MTLLKTQRGRGFGKLLLVAALTLGLAPMLSTTASAQGFYPPGGYGYGYGRGYYRPYRPYPGYGYRGYGPRYYNRGYYGAPYIRPYPYLPYQPYGAFGFGAGFGGVYAPIY